MEAAIQTVVKVFLKSTKGKESLGKKDFQNLVKSQLSNILSDTDSKEAVNNMGQGLDANHDGKVGFEEYMKLVGYLAVSLSEQRALAMEPGQNAASEPAAAKVDGKTEANAEAKPGEEKTADGAAQVKVEANADGKIEVKVEAKADGENTLLEATKEEEKPAAAAAVEVEVPAVEPAAVEAAAAVEMVVKEEEKVVVVETEKVELVEEKTAAAAEEEEEEKKEEEEEKKTEEATS